ncbi:MAG: FHA domain-containing protein [Paracoccaceae bacterium]
MKFLKEILSKKSQDSDPINVDDVAAMINDAEAEEPKSSKSFNNMAAIQSRLKGLKTQHQEDEFDLEETDQLSDFADVLDDINAPVSEMPMVDDIPKPAQATAEPDDMKPIMSEDDFAQLDDELARLSDDLAKANEDQEAPSKQMQGLVLNSVPETKHEPRTATQPQARIQRVVPAQQNPETVVKAAQPQVIASVEAPNAETPKKTITFKVSEAQGGGSVPEKRPEAAVVQRPAPVEMPVVAAAPQAPLAPSIEQPSHIVEVPAPAAGRSRRRAGRVKTRLLGFEKSQGGKLDPFEGEKQPVISNQVSFPVGWIIVVQGPGRGTAFALFNGVTNIGRGEDQPVKLDFGDSSISRENHAAIAYDNEQHCFFLGQGGKANLVRLNGTPVLSTEKLSNSDLIRIGETTLRFVALCDEEFNWDADSKEDTSNAATA